MEPLEQGADAVAGGLQDEQTIRPQALAQVLAHGFDGGKTLKTLQHQLGGLRQRAGARQVPDRLAHGINA
jgi:hypothetical protein